MFMSYKKCSQLQKNVHDYEECTRISKNKTTVLKKCSSFQKKVNDLKNKSQINIFSEIGKKE